MWFNAKVVLESVLDSVDGSEVGGAVKVIVVIPGVDWSVSPVAMMSPDLSPLWKVR